MRKWHKNLESRFGTFPDYQQILMVANELNRGKNLCGTDRQEGYNCLERAMELIDMIVSSKKWKGKLKEILRLREVVTETYAKGNFSFDDFDRLVYITVSLNSQAYTLLKK